MNDRPADKPPPTPFGPGRKRRVAFAAALVALPLFSTLIGVEVRNSAPRAPASAAVLTKVDTPGTAAIDERRAPTAAPDYALLDARDVRRALPAPTQSLDGIDATTL